MRRHLLFLFSITVMGLLVAPQFCQAQPGRSGLITPVQARRHGLVRAWTAHIELDRSRSRITHLIQHVSSSQFLTVHEIVYEQGKITITPRQIDSFGRPLGKEGAKQLAEKKLSELLAAGHQAKRETRDVPEVTLLALTDHATLHALDGQTGRTRWVTRIGNSKYPSLAPATSDQVVALINGSTLYLLNLSDGKLVWERRVGGVPGVGPAVSDYLAFVPMMNGLMEIYSLDPEIHRPLLYPSSGRAFVRPTITPRTVSWTTDQGHLYVADATTGQVRFRLETDKKIVAPSTFQTQPGRLFVASLDGYVYASEESTGDLLWRFSSGEPISHSPVVIGESIYVITDDAGMYCLSAETGQEKWWTHQVRRFVAAGKDRIYCTVDRGQLVVIDAKTGAWSSRIDIGSLDLALLNWQTDRIVVGNSNGLIQCLHESAHQWPLVHVRLLRKEQAPPADTEKGGDQTEQPPKPAAKKDKPKRTKPADDEEEDPFG